MYRDSMLVRDCQWPPDSWCNHQDSRKGDPSHSSQYGRLQKLVQMSRPPQEKLQQPQRPTYREPGLPPTHHGHTVLLLAPDPLWVGEANWLAVHHGILPFILVLTPFMASDVRSSCEKECWIQLPWEPMLNRIQRPQLLAQSPASP